MAGRANNGASLRVNANGNAVVSANPGTILGRVLITVAGATGNLLTLRHGDSTGPIIAVIDTTTKMQFEFDLICSRGLHYTLATGTAADLVILYS